MLELRNTGYRDVYVTVLDLHDEGSIGPLWPYPGLRVSDNRIPADGQWVRIPEPFVFQIEGPAAFELFKAIATVEPADFSPLLDAQSAAHTQRNAGLAPDGPGSALGELLRAATLGQRSSATIAPGNWATAEVGFVVTDPD